jgi:hypothetical protein
MRSLASDGTVVESLRQSRRGDCVEEDAVAERMVSVPVKLIGSKESHVLASN